MQAVCVPLLGAAVEARQPHVDHVYECQLGALALGAALEASGARATRAAAAPLKAREHMPRSMGAWELV